MIHDKEMKDSFITPKCTFEDEDDEDDEDDDEEDEDEEDEDDEDDEDEDEEDEDEDEEDEDEDEEDEDEEDEDEETHYYSAEGSFTATFRICCITQYMYKCLKITY